MVQDLDGKVQVLEMDSAEQQRKVQSLEVATGGCTVTTVTTFPIHNGQSI